MLSATVKALTRERRMGGFDPQRLELLYFRIGLLEYPLFLDIVIDEKEKEVDNNL